jgi:hypothetical protein
MTTAIQCNVALVLKNDCGANVWTEATVELSDDKTFFRVHSFVNAESKILLPMEEVFVRYVTECTLPHWVDDKYNAPSPLTLQIGKAIEATTVGQEYIMYCFLRTMG